MNAQTLERFWNKVDKSGDCWLWTGSKRSKGYGAFVYPSTNGDIIQGRAHRFSWEIHYGEIPAGVCVLHKCDTPACVNPIHLWLGTKDDNNKDMVNKGRHVSGGTHCGTKGKWKRGKDHHAAKITPEIVINIRKDRESCMSYSQLMDKYNLSQIHLWRIVQRQRWAWVKEEGKE